MKKLLFVLFIFNSGILLCQNNRVNKFIIYAGVGYSNINNYAGPVGASLNSLSQQSIATPVNSPNYMWTYQLGITKGIKITNELKFDIGLKLFQRGRSDYGRVVFPVRGIVPQRLSYIGITKGFSFFPLRSKNISINSSLTTAYLFYVNKLPGLDQDALLGPRWLNLEMNIGINIPIFSRIILGISFNQALNILKSGPILDPNGELVFPVVDYDFETKDIIHAFEFNLYYAF